MMKTSEKLLTYIYILFRKLNRHNLEKKFIHIIKNKNYLNNTTLWYLFSSTNKYVTTYYRYITFNYINYIIYYN